MGPHELVGEVRRFPPTGWNRGERVPPRLDLVLRPAEYGFRAGVAVRNWLYDSRVLRAESATIPIICIGNLTVGGTGKTPVAAWIARWFRDRGRSPAIVLRGYGGDEERVHAELNPEIPVFTGRRRVEAVIQAQAAGADCVVLDDGFQHRRLARDLDVVLVATEQWNPPFRRLPRGPWRESAKALRRAHLVLVTRKTATLDRARAIADEIRRITGGNDVVGCHLRPTSVVPLDRQDPTPAGLDTLHGGSVLAVASLADPAPFVEQLERAGARVELAAYPDHHMFTRDEVDALVRHAHGRVLAMTRKEAVKLRPLLPLGTRAVMLDQILEFEWGGEGLISALERTVGGSR